MNAWTIAKGILIAVAILTVVSLGMSVVMLTGFSSFLSSHIETQASKQPQRRMPSAPVIRTKTTNASETRAGRMDTPKGIKLGRDCDDWLNALADYDYPSTRQGAAKACGRYERYLATGN